eukprot:COSAG01_NODE_87_length_27454_cov_201.243575_17_plen_69_part_00
MPLRRTKCAVLPLSSPPQQAMHQSLVLICHSGLSRELLLHRFYHPLPHRVHEPIFFRQSDENPAKVKT